MLAVSLFIQLLAGEARCPEDACLRGIAFIDANNGWTVGDDGAIWRTTDGGARWERQSGGTRGTLRKVVFQDARRGWICGREDGPAGASGVLLVTRDGGESWQRVLASAVPALEGIAFVNDNEGFLWGEAGGPYSSGLFKTKDGGRSWAPVSGLAPGGWVSAWFASPDAGWLTGRDGRVYQFSGKEWYPIPADALGERKALACHSGIAAGDGGLLIDQQNGRWSLSRTHIDAKALAQAEWRGLCRQGDRVLVAGSPGSVVLLSEDGGKHFAPRATGTPLAMHDCCLLPDGTAHACGAMGTVIRSVDGGKTWSIPRKPLEHATILVVGRSASALPWRTVARHGWEDGLAVAALTASADATANGFPATLRKAGFVAAETGRPGPTWRERLVMALRQFQPEHLLLEDVPGDKGWLMDATVALQWAADPAKCPEQIEALGLKPWLGGIAWRSSGPMDSMVRVDGRKPSDRLADTVDGHVASLLADSGLPASEESAFEGWTPLRPNPGQAWASLLAASSARLRGAQRPLPAPEPLDPAMAKALERRRLHEVLARPGALPQVDAEAASSTLPATLDLLDDAKGAPFLDRLASGAERSGRWQLARELRAMLVERYPAHPLALSSTRWLIGHESSREVRRREELSRTVELAILQAGMPGGADAGIIARAGGKKIESPETVTRVTRETTVLDGRALARKSLESCLSREALLRASGSLAAQDPATQFMLQSARRQLGQFEQAQAYYNKAATSLTKGSPWQTAAEIELWLANRSGEPPRPAIACRQAASRPHLDGRLEDDCWINALKPLRGAGPATTVAMSFDSDFLYLAARCPGAAPDAGTVAAGRSPDSAKSSRDRVSFFLDLDRDHATGYTLTIDDQGRVADRCCADPTWDPRWFVAVAREEDGWTLEAALPLSALTGESVTSGQAWLVQVARWRGESMACCWSGAASPGATESFPGLPGLLLFLPSGKSR